MTTTFEQCRYLRRNDEQCTAEAVDTAVDAEVVLCTKHLAYAWRLITERAREATS